MFALDELIAAAGCNWLRRGRIVPALPDQAAPPAALCRAPKMRPGSQSPIFSGCSAPAATARYSQLATHQKIYLRSPPIETDGHSVPPVMPAAGFPQSPLARPGSAEAAG